ncbi:ATP-dependent helicase [Spiribacter halobius]|uniref:DNA 3'-5' helicase n=1 Tax=Sediminicurvatus halobius TaxID=2182432 RepID=A0A2U2N446_9GAMM|nr:ATP-dependent helicase [Spiribacter halobius]PWG63870.1 hypothetical protein DEM34_06610 [Spiribacter halobius]UEX76275.1 ATP-dependent helicase [Spiribacter halobius]
MLDPDQARVVAHGSGPAVVLAGAGAGKTRCTTERARRRLLEDGVPAEAMVLLTFTNKAAGEMRERLAARLNGAVPPPWIGTFHSFGSRLLRTHGEAIGVPPNATLMDAEDSRRMLDTLLAGPFSDPERRRRALSLQEALSAAGLDLTDDADLEPARDLCDAAGFGPVAAARLLQRLRRYDREKRQAAMLDFADLILLPARLLRRDPALCARLTGALRDITVDEAQDTDGAQFRLLRLLTPQDRTVVLVGDDDQAIYEWRHARPQNLRDFIAAEAPAVYRLERNYRSAPAIVTGGVALVRHNLERLEKHPYAVRPAAEETVRLRLWGDAEGMAEGVAATLQDALDAGTPADELAVLYRKNRLARPLEAALLRRGLPYRVKAGMDLLAHADVRMMLAAGRLAANRRDMRALARLADLVPGLGARGVGRLLDAGGDPLAQGGRLSPKGAAGVADLARAIDALSRQGPAGLESWCLQTPLVRDWLERRIRAAAGGRKAEAPAVERGWRPVRARLAAIQRAMQRRLQGLPAASGDAERWSAALEIAATGTEEAEPESGRITLSTIHGAKGLEWGRVHLFGFSEGLLPMARDGVVENLAEERRLAYVAVTRARDALMLHHADRVDTGDGQGVRSVAVSPFVEEIRRGQPVVEEDRRPGAELPADAGATDWLAAMRAGLGSP